MLFRTLRQFHANSLSLLFGRSFVVGGLCLSLLSSPRTFAAKSYDFVGTVTMIRGATVTVSNGKKTLEFNYSEFSELPEVPEVGDEVSVRYFLEATQTELRRRPAQQPRQLPGQRPEPFRKRGIPGEKKHILLDDRAFYDA